MSCRLLKRDEERQLLELAQRGDQRARAQLIRSNQGLIHWVIGKRRRDESEDDLLQEGNIGLLTAIERFDLRRNVKFSSYATHWIKARTQRHREVEAYNGKTGGWDNGTRKPMAVDVSLDAPLGDDSDATRLDMLADGATPADEALDAARRAAAVRGALKKLKLGPLAEEIAKHRLMAGRLEMGSSRDVGESHEEIGKRFGLSRERVRQVELSVVEKLRRFIKRELPELAAEVSA